MPCLVAQPSPSIFGHHRQGHRVLPRRRTVILRGLGLRAALDWRRTAATVAVLLGLDACPLAGLAAGHALVALGHEYGFAPLDQLADAAVGDCRTYGRVLVLRLVAHQHPFVVAQDHAIVGS